jgi:hypothetical protein
MGLSGMEDGAMGNDGRTDGGMAQAAADAARRATGRGLAEDAVPAPVCFGEEGWDLIDGVDLVVGGAR